MDINRIFPSVQGAFVCPLCLQVFLKENLEELLHQDVLSYGHVWPNAVRNGNVMAESQAVLLCKCCNSGTGGHGDAALGKLHELLEEQRSEGLCYTGKALIGAPGTDTICLPSKVVLPSPNALDPGSGQLRVRQGRYDPIQFKAWQDLVSCGQTLYYISIPPRITSECATLSDAGKLTSAYMLAFYVLGYRYILNSFLDPVRAYIIKTATGIVLDVSSLSGSGVTVFWTQTPDPRLQFTHRLDQDNSFLRVEFQQYGVTLPVPAHCHNILRDLSQRAGDRMEPDDNEFFLDITHLMPYGGAKGLTQLLGSTDYVIVADS